MTAVADGPTSRAVLVAAILASTMAFLDTSIVNIALPVIVEELGASVTGAQWILESYLLFLTALLLAGGALGDRLGRVRVFAAGIVFFALASLACGLAATPLQLTLARAVQGIGAAVMVPGSLALISAMFAPAGRGRALGLWSAVTSSAVALGPPVGGWAITATSWRVIFLINLPIAALALIALRRIPESRAETRGPLDLLGAALATVGLGAITFGLLEAGRAGFATLPSLALLLGGALLVWFLWVESRAAAPMLPLGLFRSRPFSAVQGFTLLLYAGLMGSVFVLPFALMQGQGFSPAATGFALLPMVLPISALSRWAGALADRQGPRRLLCVGAAIAAAGMGWLGLIPLEADYVTWFLPGLLVLGCGIGCCVAPVSKAALDAVGAERAGVASAVNNMVARLGGLIAIALFGLAVPEAQNGGAVTAVAAGFHAAMLVAAILAVAAAATALALPRASVTRPGVAVPSRSR